MGAILASFASTSLRVLAWVALSKIGDAMRPSVTDWDDPSLKLAMMLVTTILHTHTYIYIIYII
jgi:hypothetical protein